MKKLLIIALILLTACGSGGGGKPSPIAGNLPPQGFGGRSPSPAPSATSTTKASVSPTGTTSPDPSKTDDPTKYSAENPPPQSWRDPDIDGGATGKLRLYLRIEPGCVEQGESLTVRFKTKPDVQLAFFTGFKNADGRSTTYDGRSDAFGFWSKTVSVRPDQQAGQYDLFAAAADDKGSDGGHSGNWYFVVAERGKCAK